MNKPLTEDQMDELQGQLTALEAELRQSLKDSKSDSDPVKLDQQLMGRVSRIDAIQQQSMASASRAKQEMLLRKVVQALRLIDEGDYGYCRQCDAPIGYQRLRIKPEATLCIKCQSAAEKR
ncbi:MAG: TraR/DksA family transcriptional regulator [Ketobacteraceae bacterium]|nr:TraR/DksA family transcriptional regulator [Ketobacteraceae bacterium]